MNGSEGQAAEATQRARAVKQAYQAELMSKANVVGVGVGYLTRRGQPTDEIALVVMVSQKLPPEQLSPADLLPRQIDGVRVDVQEVGAVTAL